MKSNLQMKFRGKKIFSAIKLQVSAVQRSVYLKCFGDHSFIRLPLGLFSKTEGERERAKVGERTKSKEGEEEEENRNRLCCDDRETLSDRFVSFRPTLCIYQ